MNKVIDYDNLPEKQFKKYNPIQGDLSESSSSNFIFGFVILIILGIGIKLFLDIGKPKK